MPSAEEVAAMINRKALVVTVYLADDAPENIPYDVSTTIGEAQKVRPAGGGGQLVTWQLFFGAFSVTVGLGWKVVL